MAVIRCRWQSSLYLWLLVVSCTAISATRDRRLYLGTTVQHELSALCRRVRWSRMRSVLNLILFPFRTFVAALSASWTIAMSTIQSLRWLLIDWGWLAHVEAASEFAVTQLTMPLLKTILFLVLLTLCLGCSASVYFAFYQFYIPQTSHSFPVYFDFGSDLIQLD